MDKSKSGFIKAQVSLVAFSLATGACIPALAASKYEEEYAQGIVAYKKRDYAAATDLFWKSITDGNGSASAWLYVAHSKAGEGKLKEAREGYQAVVNIYKGTEEAKAAASYIKALDAKTWQPGPPAKAAAAAPPVLPASAAPAVPATAAGLLGHVVIIPPREGHTKVSAQTVASVKQSIEKLPRAIRKILDDGGAVVNIAPNIIDRWPDSLSMVRPGVPDQSIAEEPGRTYGREINVYERAIVTKGSRELGPPRSPQEIQINFLHEVGHALDDCMGLYTKDAGFLNQYKMDVGGLREESKTGMEIYLPAESGPSEVAAEATCILLGGAPKNSELFKRNFSRSFASVKSKLKL